MPTATTLLYAVSLAFGTIPIGFAINWYCSTASGLSFFYQSPPIESSEHAALVDCMGTVIGVRNLVLGLALVSAAFFNEKKDTGRAIPELRRPCGRRRDRDKHSSRARRE
jgi:hypothetical protein